MKKNFFSTSFVCVGIIMWSLLHLSCSKTKLMDYGDYFFYERNGERGFVITRNYVKKLLSIEGDMEVVHFYSTSFGFRHTGKSRLLPFLYSSGPYIALGLKDIIHRCPKYYNLDANKETTIKNGKNTFEIEAEEIAIYCPEYKKTAILLLNYKEGKIEIEEIVSTISLDQMKKEFPGILE